MKKTYDITFLVFTYNEERRIEYMLRCIQGNGEIIVIDNNSEDRTREIAARYTKKIFTFQNPGYVENDETMAFAIDKVTTKWVYIALVDEIIPLKLMSELKKIAKSDQYKIVEIFRKNFMYGQEVFNYDHKPTLRMFVPGAVNFKGNIVHKMGRYMVSKTEVYKFHKNDELSIWHFSPYNTSRLELVHNRYANLEALQRASILGKKFSGIRAIWKFVFYFLGTYFGFGGFRGGWPGFFISVQIAYFKFSIEARLWDIEHKVTPENIEIKYDDIKEQLLQANYVRIKKNH